MLRSTHTAQSRKALQSKSGSKIAKVGVVGKKINELRSGFIAREGKPSSEVTWDITASDESNHMLVQTCKHARECLTLLVTTRAFTGHVTESARL